MKIKITYQRDEAIGKVVQALTEFFPSGRWRFSDRYPPYLHAYLTVDPLKEQDERKTLCEKDKRFR